MVFANNLCSSKTFDISPTNQHEDIGLIDGKTSQILQMSLLTVDFLLGATNV
jgi:hypothetical protein